MASLVDVRTAPGSRHNPETAREAMQHWLPEAGIGYRWEPRLGGWRRVKGESPDVGLRNDSFRSYAGYMRSEEFRAGIDQLLAEADVIVPCNDDAGAAAFVRRFVPIGAAGDVH